MRRIENFEFSTVVTSEDYFVRDHRVHNIKVLPGTTFFDLIYRAFLSEGVDVNKVELRNIFFKEPIIVNEDYDREVSIIYENFTDYGTIIVKSHRIKDGTILDEDVENYSAQVYSCEGVEENSIDIEYLKSRANHIDDMEDYYSNTRNMHIHHYEYMKGIGKIYDGDDFLLAEIHLCELAETERNHYFISPVYLDAATIVALSLFHNELFEKEPKPCIPIHVDKFTAVRTLNEICYVYVDKNTKRTSKTNDVYYIGFEIYDEQGKRSVQISNLVAKSVRKKELLESVEFGTKHAHDKKIEHKAVENKTIQEKPKTVFSQTQTAVKPTTDKEMLKLIENVLIKVIEEVREEELHDFSVTKGFYDQGLDSEDLMTIVTKLEERLHVQLYPTLLFEYVNIKNLAQYLFENYKKECSIFFEVPDEKVAENEMLDSHMQENDLWYFTRTLNKFPIKSSGHGIAENILFLQSRSDFDIRLGYRLDSCMMAGKSCRTISLDETQNNFSAILKEQSNGQNENLCLLISGDYVLRQGKEPALVIFELVKSVLNTNSKVKFCFYYSNTQENVLACRAAASLLKSAVLEKNTISYKVIELDEVEDVIQMTDEIEELSYNIFVRYQNGIRFTEGLKEAEFLEKQPSVKVRADGVYIITGGVGKIGFTVASYLALQGHAVFVLTGRRSMNDAIEKQLEELRSRQCDAVYIQADMSKAEEVESLIKNVKKTYGSIYGIIHSAGVIQDSFIRNKTEEEFKKVLSVKVDGCRYLDEYTREEPLDFFVLFSSSASLTGNIGQADYSYANGYLDYFSEYREALRKEGLRNGRCVSVNWPFWENGGMAVTQQTKRNMKEKLGMEPISNEEGVRAFVTAVSGKDSHVFVMKCEATRAEQFLEQMNEVLTDTVKTEMNRKIEPDEDAIAIVGLDGKYPMADNLKEFWDNLCRGKDCITEIPGERFDYKSLFNPDKNSVGTIYSKWGGFLNGIDQFNPTFFQISPKEAEIMDPQERLFLQTVWHVFEDSGMNIEDFDGREIGVYVGVMWGQYQLIHHEVDGKPFAPTSIFSSVANRVSYTFNFTGPSMAVDTMCSSSLTALQLACSSIRNGECEMAVAGGVNLNLHQNKYLFLSQQKFASTEGKCRSFGEGGDGYVPGEGVGAVLLKPLSKAIKDKDNIYGVIKGSAVTHGGRTSGYTVPNPKSECKTVLKALKNAGVTPDEIDYIEAHGTGTALGDPIEISALDKAFGEYTKKKAFCAIGSVKSNIGHLEAAAGIAGITKVLLQMKHKKFVPSIHAAELNKKIDFEHSAFYVQRDCEEWKTRGHKRMAGISAFGAGGSNAHVILEEFVKPEETNTEKTGDGYLVTISAQTKTGLSKYVDSYIHFIRSYISPNKRDSKESAETVREIQEEMAKVLEVGVEEIDENNTLMDYGFESYTWNKLRNSLQDRFQTEVNVKDGFEGKTAVSLAHEILYESDLEQTEQEIPEFKEEKLLEQIAYVSQTGRKKFAYRIGILTHSLEELEEQLMLFEKKQDSLENCGIYFGNIKSAPKKSFTEEQVQEALEKRDFNVLAKAYIDGIEIAWKQLYDSGLPWKISIPEYPFETKRYWLGSFDEKRDKQLNPGAKIEKIGKSKEQPIKAEETEKVKMKQIDVETEFDRELYKKAAQYDGDEVILEVVKQHIAVVHMQDRKSKNSFSENMVHGLIHRFQQIEENPDIKVVILTGYDNIFCMGGTKEQLIGISDQKYRFTDVKFLHRGLLETKVPVIAAMQGHAYGGGFLFGLFADMVIMAEEGIYSAVFMKYGFTPGMGATMILDKRFGESLALEMMYTAKNYSGLELKNRAASVMIRPQKDVLPQAMQIAELISEKPVNTLKVFKNEMASRTLEKLFDVIDRENAMHALTFTNDDVKERISQYYGKKENKKEGIPKKENIQKKENEKKDLEYLKILEMVQKGEITKEQAKKLMKFL